MRKMTVTLSVNLPADAQPLACAEAMRNGAVDGLAMWLGSALPVNAESLHVDHAAGMMAVATESLDALNKALRELPGAKREPWEGSSGGQG